MKQALRIKSPGLYSFRESAWFLDRNLDDVMHHVEGGHVRRLVDAGQGPMLLQVSESQPDLLLERLAGANMNQRFAKDFVSQWFDLDRDILPFYKLLAKDPDLSALATRYRGFRMVGIPDLFEALCWCVIGQQINLAFAYRIKRRLVEAYGQRIEHEGRSWYLFPAPEVLMELRTDVFREIQLTTRKAEYIQGISRLFFRGDFSREQLLSLKDEKLMLQELMKIRGIGEWTANYALMKSLRGMNCVPYGDSGINNALLQLKGIPKKNNRLQVDAVFDRFEGWKSYLVFYLWRTQREPVA